MGCVKFLLLCDEERLLRKSEELGVPGNLALAAYVERLEQRLEKLEETR